MNGSAQSVQSLVLIPLMVMCCPFLQSTWVFLLSDVEKDLGENLDSLCGENFHQGEGFL